MRKLTLAIEYIGLIYRIQRALHKHILFRAGSIRKRAVSYKVSPLRFDFVYGYYGIMYRLSSTVVLIINRVGGSQAAQL